MGTNAGAPPGNNDNNNAALAAARRADASPPPSSSPRHSSLLSRITAARDELNAALAAAAGGSGAGGARCVPGRGHSTRSSGRPGRRVFFFFFSRALAFSGAPCLSHPPTPFQLTLTPLRPRPQALHCAPSTPPGPSNLRPPRHERLHARPPGHRRRRRMWGFSTGRPARGPVDGRPTLPRHPRGVHPPATGPRGSALLPPPPRRQCGGRQKRGARARRGDLCARSCPVRRRTPRPPGAGLGSYGRAPARPHR